MRRFMDVLQGFEAQFAGQSFHLGGVSGEVGRDARHRRGEAVEGPPTGLWSGDLGDVAGDREGSGGDRPGAEGPIQPGVGGSVRPIVQADT
jgi:hypothetical protein